MTVDNLTKLEWLEIQRGLALVPQRSRTKAYEKATAFVARILADTNNVAVPVAPDSIHYNVSCRICKYTIHILDDFICFPGTGDYAHYDCNYRTGKGNLKD